MIALFTYTIGSLTLRFRLQYWTEEAPIEIATRAMFERTMENVAAVAQQLEILVAESNVC